MDGGSFSDAFRTVAIVQARMASTRLPGKVMKPICGTPLIGWLFQRLARTENVDEIVLATSSNSKNQPLIEHNILGCYRSCYRFTFQPYEETYKRRFGVWRRYVEFFSTNQS